MADVTEPSVGAQRESSSADGLQDAPPERSPAGEFPTQPTPSTSERPLVDPRAIRVSLASASAHADLAPIVVEPPAVPVAPGPNRTAPHSIGGVGAVEPLGIATSSPPDGVVLVDGDPVEVRLDHLGAVHRAIRDETTNGAGPTRTRVIILPADAPVDHTTAGTTHREVVVDGWRIEVEIESERRASLRERARRSRAETAHGGPTEVRAIIPGVIASVSVVPGDAVVAGQHILVVEAMKMQNELRAPRDGVVSRLAVGAGKTIEVGDLLLVLE